MSVNALARVIYHVDASSAAKATGGAKLVIVDRNSKQVLPKKPWLSFGKDLRYLRVMSRSLAVEGEGPRVEVQGNRFDDRLELKVKYRARCLPGKEEQLAVALGLGERPDLELNNWLHHQLETLVDGIGRTEDLFSMFQKMLPDVERQLSSAAARELGLSLRLQIQAQDRRDAAERIDLSIQDLEVHARDSDERIRLQMEIHLEVEDSAKAVRYSTGVDEWQRRLAESVRQFVASEVALHELAFDLRMGLRSKIQAMLDREVSPAGRRVGYLQLGSNYQQGGIEGYLRLEHDVVCDIQGSREQVYVQHVIQLELQDLGKFQTAGVRDLRAWVCDHLDRITRNTFFEMTYRDLLVQFAPYEDRGPSRLRQMSEPLLESAGYVIRQMTVVPELEPLSWREGFTLELKEGTYATLDPRIEVGLGFFAEGSVKDIFDARLKRYLDPKSAGEFLSDMEKRMTTALAGTLHGLSPERFYMRWRQSSVADEEPVVELLTRALKDVMSQDFAVVDPHVVVKPLETELTKRVEELVSQVRELSVKVLPLSGNGKSEEVTFDMDVEIRGVHENGWHTFRSRVYESIDAEIEETKRLLKNEIQSTLSTIPNEHLQFVTRQSQKMLEQILRATCLSVQHSCGLVVSVRAFRRGETGIEGKRRALILSRTEAEIKNQDSEIQADGETRTLLAQELNHELAALVERKTTLLSEGVELDDQEIQTAQERINEIRAALKTARSEEDRDPLDHLEYRDRSPLRLEEYGVDSDESGKSLDTDLHDQKSLT